MKAGVAYVILGALRDRPKSGYEIKQLVDKATRFFWAASYGQIYPELRRLTDGGLIEPVGNGGGGRKRIRYELTETGRAALVEWLREPTARYELRDEWLLKLFFADALDPADALELVRSFRAEREGILEQLRRVEANVPKEHAAFPFTVLQYGLEACQWDVDWCTRLEQRLMQDGATREGS